MPTSTPKNIASKFSPIAVLASFPTSDVECNYESDANGPFGQGTRGYGGLDNDPLRYAPL